QMEDEDMVAWDSLTRAHVLRAIEEYDRLGPERFFSEHGFAPTTTYELAWEERRYPPKAILGTAYEFATGERLASRDFEGGRTGAVSVLAQLGFTVQEKRRPARQFSRWSGGALGRARGLCHGPCADASPRIHLSA